MPYPITKAELGGLKELLNERKITPCVVLIRQIIDLDLKEAKALVEGVFAHPPVSDAQLLEAVDMEVSEEDIRYLRLLRKNQALEGEATRIREAMGRRDHALTQALDRVCLLDQRINAIESGKEGPLADLNALIFSIKVFSLEGYQCDLGSFHFKFAASQPLEAVLKLIGGAEVYAKRVARAAEDESDDTYACLGNREADG